MSAAAARGLGTIAFGPLDVWFRIVAGLPAHLADLALTPIRIAVILPLLSVIQAFQRALLVQARVTGLAIGALAGARVLGVAFLTWLQMSLTPGPVPRQG